MKNFKLTVGTSWLQIIGGLIALAGTLILLVPSVRDGISLPITFWTGLILSGSFITSGVYNLRTLKKRGNHE